MFGFHLNWNSLENNFYDIIFMDIEMPEMNGIEVMNKFRTFPHFKNTKFLCIACTADALSGSNEKYLKEGFDAYMPKPYTIDEVRKVKNSFEMK